MIKLLQRLWPQLSRRRQYQLLILLGLMFVSAFAEIVSLGAIIPFLAVISDPNGMARFPLIEHILERVGLTGAHDFILTLTLAFASAAICAGAMRVVLSWGINKFTFVLSHDFAVKVYEIVIYQSYIWHISRNTSNTIATIDKVRVVTGGVLTPLMQAISGTLIGLFIFGALIALNPVISLITLVGFGSIYSMISFLARRTLNLNGQAIARAWSERLRSIQEGLGGIRDVLLDGSQRIFLNRFGLLDYEFGAAQAQFYFIGVSPRFAIEAIGMVLISLLAYFLSSSKGGLIAFLPVLGALALGSQRLLPLMHMIYNSWTSLVGNRQILSDVLDLLDTPVPEGMKSVSNERLPFEREIVFRNVSFHYSERQKSVVKNLTFTIKKGARVGIIGTTGSGKSTAADLLMGLLEPSAGTIEVDGIRLSSARCRAWQQQLAHVPQSIFLADTSIADNIAYGIDPANIDQIRVREAARKAQLAPFIETLPEGYKTVVGERGIQLSGGQRQRIGIARALYRQAKVMVFDEATSALDSDTEAAVIQAIRNLGAELTIVIIAHRHSTVSFCNQVLRIENGRLTESGSYEDVILRGAISTEAAKQQDQAADPPVAPI